MKLVVPNLSAASYTVREVRLYQSQGLAITLSEQHRFSSGKHVVTLSGVHPEVDGALEVYKKIDRNTFAVVKGVRVNNIDFQALNATLQQPNSTARAR